MGEGWQTRKTPVALIKASFSWITDRREFIWINRCWNRRKLNLSHRNPTQRSSCWSFKLFNPFYTHLQFIWTQVSNIFNTPRPRNAIRIRLQARRKSHKGTQARIKKKKHRTFPPGARCHFQTLLTLPNSHPLPLNCPCAPIHITSTIPGVSTSASKTATNWSGSQSRPELTQPQRHLFPASGVTKHSGQPTEKHSKKASSSSANLKCWGNYCLSMEHMPHVKIP